MSNMIRNMIRKITQRKCGGMLGRSMTRSRMTSEEATVRVRREMMSVWTESSTQRRLRFTVGRS